MSWKLWIDDDANKPDIEAWRKPPEGETDWKVATSSAEALKLVYLYGVSEFIDFDHDLGLVNGKKDTSMTFLHRLYEMDFEAILSISDYRIHSANPDGAKNIQAYMDSWRRALAGEQ